MDKIIYYAIPFFLVTLALEMLWAKRNNSPIYADRKDTAASLGMGIGNVILAGIAKPFTILLALTIAWEYRLWTLDFEAYPLLFLLLIPMEDFFYYWYHRAGHRIRIVWASHINHHSSQQYNLSTALRQSWPGVFYSFVFWIPLPLLGVHPAYVLTAKAINLVYQYWIHTETIRRLPGWFELIFNTPSHHRVHHGSNPQYIDRNYGGILIIWDRLFGTFEPEQDPVKYGLTKNISSYNPLYIAFHAWVAMLKDIARAPSWREKLLIPWMPPAWFSEREVARQGQVSS